MVLGVKRASKQTSGELKLELEEELELGKLGLGKDRQDLCDRLEAQRDSNASQTSPTASFPQWTKLLVFYIINEM